MLIGNAVAINRDPFARSTLMRRRADSHDAGSCKWCAQPNSRFHYRWEADGVQRYAGGTWNGPFCGVDCYRSYNS